MPTYANNYGKYNTEEMTELAEQDPFVEAQKSMLNELIDARVDLMTKHYDDAYRRITRLVNELSEDIKISTKKNHLQATKPKDSSTKYL